MANQFSPELEHNTAVIERVGRETEAGRLAASAVQLVRNRWIDPNDPPDGLEPWVNCQTRGASALADEFGLSLRSGLDLMNLAKRLDDQRGERSDAAVVGDVQAAILNGKVQLTYMSDRERQKVRAEIDGSSKARYQAREGADPTAASTATVDQQVKAIDDLASRENISRAEAARRLGHTVG